MPIYCETALNSLGTFPAEPVNTITSFVPAVLGVLALVYLLRSQNRSAVAWALAVLTVLTGLGSAAWHSMRTELTLLVDWLPGVIYFLIVVAVWALHAAGRYLSLALLVMLSVLAFLVPFPAIHTYRLIIIAALLVVAAALLAATWYRQRAAFPWAGAMVGAAVVAITMRTLDLYTCDIIPVGTHFLWHVFLGVAAFAGVHMTLRLSPERTSGARPTSSGAASSR